jgi:hypothetical protein
VRSAAEALLLIRPHDVRLEMATEVSYGNYGCNTIAILQHFKNQGDRSGMRRQTVAFDTAGKGESTKRRQLEL